MIYIFNFYSCKPTFTRTDCHFPGHFSVKQYYDCYNDTVDYTKHYASDRRINSVVPASKSKSSGSFIPTRVTIQRFSTNVH